jgi:hypothetical protein
MLRITPIIGPDAQPTLKVEGKLVGPWVAELGRACEAPTAPAGRPRLDLSAVTFVDAAGVRLLRELLRRGAVLAGCSGLVAEFLHGECR